MQMGVDPEDHGPLPPQSSELKTSAALNAPANPASACSAPATKYLTAHTNDKIYMDAMLGASSCNNQLPISFFQSSAERLRDATETIGANSRRVFNLIGTLSRLTATNIANTLGVVMTSGTTNTWHDTTNTIGTLSDISADKNTNILGVVMTVDQSQTDATDDDVKSIKLIILIGLITVASAAIIYTMGVVMTFNIRARSFIITTLRLGVCIGYVIKDLTPS